MGSICLFLDYTLSGGVVGVTAWFFFVQSPFLFALLGRERFVPIMMRLTRLFFNWAVAVVAGVTILNTAVVEAGSVSLTAPPLAVTLALVAVVANRTVVVPLALAAGKRSAAERRGDNTSDLTRFVVDGGSKTETKLWHQSVIALVLLMTGGVVWHLLEMSL